MPRGGCDRGALAGVFGGSGTVKQSLALAIQIAETLDLKSIGKNTKQEMTGQVRGRPPPEHGVPTGLKIADVEIAQARDLDIEWSRIRQRRTDLHTRHVAQAARRLDCWPLALAPSSPSMR